MLDWGLFNLKQACTPVLSGLVEHFTAIVHRPTEVVIGVPWALGS